MPVSLRCLVTGLDSRYGLTVTRLLRVATSDTRVQRRVVCCTENSLSPPPPPPLFTAPRTLRRVVAGPPREIFERGRSAQRHLWADGGPHSVARGLELDSTSRPTQFRAAARRNRAPPPPRRPAPAPPVNCHGRAG
ncbi:unnamed protein product, partial [Iphiclides podalirius]